MFGMIGLGHMGRAIARNLAAQQPLLVFDVRAESVAELVALGATGATSVEQLARDCTDVIVCVNTEHQVEEVLNTLIANKGALETVTVNSTVSPEFIVAEAARCAEAGLFLVDAPVSGNIEARDSGNLTMFVGSSDGEPSRLAEAYDAFAGTIHRCGPPGAGQAAKLTNNILALIGLMASAEAVEFGATFGMDQKTVQAVVGSASGDCYALRNIDYYRDFKGEHPLGHDDEAFFAFMRKDLNSAYTSASDRGVDLVLTQAAAAVSRDVYRQFWSKGDHE